MCTAWVPRLFECYIPVSLHAFCGLYCCKSISGPDCMHFVGCGKYPGALVSPNGRHWNANSFGKRRFLCRFVDGDYQVGILKSSSPGAPKLDTQIKQCWSWGFAIWCPAEKCLYKISWMWQDSTLLVSWSDKLSWMWQDSTLSWSDKLSQMSKSSSCPCPGKLRKTTCLDQDPRAGLKAIGDLQDYVRGLKFSAPYLLVRADCWDF